MFPPRLLVVWSLLPLVPGNNSVGGRQCDTAHINGARGLSFTLSGGYRELILIQPPTSASWWRPDKERQMKKTALIVAAVTALAATAATAPAQARGFGLAAGIAAAVAAGAAADVYYNSGYGYYGGPIYYHTPYYGWHRHYYRHYYYY
jgi:hypothetical protein